MYKITHKIKKGCFCPLNNVDKNKLKWHGTQMELSSMNNFVQLFELIPPIGPQGELYEMPDNKINIV